LASSEGLEQYEENVVTAVKEYMMAAGVAEHTDVIACMSVALRLSSPFETTEQYRACLIGGTHGEAAGLGMYASNFHSTMMSRGMFD